MLWYSWNVVLSKEVKSSDVILKDALYVKDRYDLTIPPYTSIRELIERSIHKRDYRIYQKKRCYYATRDITIMDSTARRLIT